MGRIPGGQVLMAAWKASSLGHGPTAESGVMDVENNRNPDLTVQVQTGRRQSRRLGGVVVLDSQSLSAALRKTVEPVTEIGPWP